MPLWELRTIPFFKSKSISSLLICFKLISSFVVYFWWSEQRGLNSQPSEWQSDALPIELCPHQLEPVDGLEPPTYWLQISCATNYAIPAHHSPMLQYVWNILSSYRRMGAYLVTQKGVEPSHSSVKGWWLYPIRLLRHIKQVLPLPSIILEMWIFYKRSVPLHLCPNGNLNGSPCRTRTYDPQLNRLSLYQLS